MGWLIPFLRSHGIKAWDTISKELYKLFWKCVVVPLMAWAWSFVLSQIADFGRLRNSCVSFLRMILPAPNSQPTTLERYFFYLATFLVVLKFWKWSTARKVKVDDDPLDIIQDMRDEVMKHQDETLKGVTFNMEQIVKDYNKNVVHCLDSHVGPISLLKSAVEGLNDTVLKDLDSGGGPKYYGRKRGLLTDLNSEFLKYERATVAFFTDQLIHLKKMKRIVAEFTDESTMIAYHANNCNTLMRIREDFFLKLKGFNSWL